MAGNTERPPSCQEREPWVFTMQRRAQLYFGKDPTVTLPSANAHSWLCMERRRRAERGDRGERKEGR
ncbi:hypothetical protein KUCAC02_002010 [Chaenocephalus aceratus]|uniref:Uncharacterized protein n=1 Tax=Chaenocephalus aceratus TaxID=36190 RepID=A0ACB9XSF3_CHAAC|nr:hypothetical protein KUCAC02_002010 [Chaenocephalus aceratus]